MPEPKFAPLALDEEGYPVVVCEACGSRNLELDGWDIDKCQDCGHWRYRGQEVAPSATEESEASDGR